MEKGKKSVYLEKTSHTTKAMPYAVYKSRFKMNGEDALYPHWHPEIELLLLESGEMDFMIEDVCCHIRAGDVMFVPANLLHMAKAADARQENMAERDLRGHEGAVSDSAELSGQAQKGVFRALVFSTDLIATPQELSAFQKYVQPLLQNPISFWLHLNEETEWQREVIGDLKRIFAQEERGGAELLTAGLVKAIWHNLYSHHFERIAQKRVSGRLQLQLQGALDYMHENFQEELTLQMLAGTAHMSEGQFCRSFKQLTGNTPFSYLKRYRILKSCAYLSETDKKISEICTLCGFNNISYFNREFLKMIKVKPSVYRARCRKEEKANGFK